MFRFSPVEFAPDCVAKHMGYWLIEPGYMLSCISAIKSGVFTAKSHASGVGRAATKSGTNGGQDSGFIATPGGTAIVPIVGPMMKADSKFGGTNTVRTRQAIRAAVNDRTIERMLLYIDSPGGTVAGTDDLADDVAKAGKEKPVRAFIEDVGASAAYWVASQAQSITATKTSMIGSIGVIGVIEDTSGKAAMEGIRVHVLAVPAAKGAFADGAPVSEGELEEARNMVAALADHFIREVAKGRKITLAKANLLGDGKVHLAKEALSMGYIDSIATIDETLNGFEGVSHGRAKTARALAIAALDA